MKLPIMTVTDEGIVFSGVKTLILNGTTIIFEEEEETCDVSKF